MQDALYRVNMIIAFVPLAVSLIVFPFLPEMFITRFSPEEIWSGKWSSNGIMALFFLPALSLVFFWIFYRAGPIMYGMGMNNGKPLTSKHWGTVVLFTIGILLMVHMWYIGSVLLSI
ncbi:MAG: hypothetical protein FWF40_00010 [Methanomassiliicoccaceae archaeon]|nr:hypothetical protein [Methanomassiliicoccaceae archaeon]